MQPSISGSFFLNLWKVSRETPNPHDAHYFRQSAAEPGYFRDNKSVALFSESADFLFLICRVLLARTYSKITDYHLDWI